ncbi:esterase FE4-like [Belonocnema kinseyi]|uniref:esterase FE4-like n=1 Tax=Belonocnema kinseyi TaxID=2817044 RepID=UPI00143CDABE|nr:esterase FE4-like [Belonocnema kinseyi]
MCPQVANDGKVIGDEDCLYLNVYSPVKNTFKGVLLPVMVWIHGGGFFGGSAGPSQFDPKYLLEKDIVLVAMNYRLAILGFFSTGDSVAPGNFGLKDQNFALKWVQKNIQFFGGDPNRVTIFGESAGGASINFHAISDASNGLFHQYIIESGSVLAAWSYRERSLFKPHVDKVAKKLGCPINSSADVVKCLKKQTAAQLLTALIFQTLDFPALNWMPTDEPKSEEAFLTDSPENLVKQNKMKNCPVISGNVHDEGLLVTLQLVSPKRLPGQVYVPEGPPSTFCPSASRRNNKEREFFPEHAMSPASAPRAASPVKIGINVKKLPTFEVRDKIRRALT